MELNVLTVELDGHPDWEKIRAYLKRKGLSVHTVSAMKEAYGAVREMPVNIVLSGFSPDRKGSLVFLRRIRAIKPHVQVIFLCEKVALSRAIEAMKDGAYDFYEFPVDPRLLMTVMTKAAERQTLFMEKTELERLVREKFNFSNIVGRSKAMQHIVDIVNSVAPKNASVLLTGETGTGKEMIANAIHFNSPRSSRPFIRVNCAAFNEGVLESELFGHEKGSFTGAIAKRVGRFELAEGGTLFLDEIGDIPLSTQTKLLRILQEKEFERVGGNDTIKVDVRLIAATNKNIESLIEEGGFRKDLYYRLNVVHIELPPLRQRKEDIPLLVSHFITKLNDEKEYGIKGISKKAMQILLNYRWPGNVRELENALESAMAIAEKGVIEAKYLPSFLLLARPDTVDFYQFPQNLTLSEVERHVIRLALEKTNGNKTMASKLLGIGLRTLHRKAKDL